MYDIDDNQIGPFETEYFSKAHWKNLTQLNLRIDFLTEDKNRILNAGCYFLCKGDWKNLTILDLSINLRIQLLTKLEI